MTLKQKTHELVEHNEYFSYSIILLIILNVLVISFDTVSTVHDKYESDLNKFEIITVAAFTIEYVLRIWSYHGDRLKYMFKVYSVIDLLAILPFYFVLFINNVIPNIFPNLVTLDTATNISILRIARLFRFAMVLKITRYSESLQLFGRVLRRSKVELVASMLVIFIILIISSVLVYFAEHIENKEKFGSIPAAVWWGVITLTTVGYGDVYPITPLGKFLGAIIMLLSIGLFALPSGIIAAGFIEEIKCKDVVCPHCGKKMSRTDEHLKAG